MTIALARALMLLAGHWLGPARRDWAAAMQAEFEIAAEAGAPLPFAAGCLWAAGRAMVAQPIGRFAVAAHMLAVGVVVPMAGLLLWSAALGFPYLALAGGGWPSVPVNAANGSGVPLLTMLTALLGGGHLLIAWAMLERDWARVAKLGRLGAAMLATVVAFSGILFPYDPCALPQALAIGVELIAILVLVDWHGDLAEEGMA